MSAAERALAMAQRLEAAAARAGVPAAALPTLRHALLASLERRTAQYAEPRHPAFLHPARTALVLLHDTAMIDPDALTAGLLIDSAVGELGFDTSEAEALVGTRPAAIVDQVPIPSRAGDRLLEMLITASEPALLVALAERLDHARHLHLQPTADWPGFHEEIRTVYTPVAERAHPTLARRYVWWTAMFGRRHLGLDA